MSDKQIIYVTDICLFFIIQLFEFLKRAYLDFRMHYLQICTYVLIAE